MNACFNIASLDALTRQNVDLIADTEITIDEVNYALKILKNDRSSGHDDLDSEHIKYAGEVCKVVLKQMFNTILSLEAVPQCFKHGVITPIYKGSNRHPLLCNSYRGITVC